MMARSRRTSQQPLPTSKCRLHLIAVWLMSLTMTSFNSILMSAVTASVTPRLYAAHLMTSGPRFAAGGQSITGDYCQFETFNASCPADHVIVITSARYGRIADSRCADKNYGGIGCVADVISLADQRCSGRTHCRITVAEISLLGIQPCPKDLTSYFEVSYRCLRVEMPAEQPCSTTRPTKVTSMSGFLPSIPPIPRLTSSAPIGRSCRWLIETEVGRRINLTIYDFTVTSGSSAATATNYCKRLAMFRDVESGRETNVCTGNERIRQVHVSEGHSVEVAMVTNAGSAPDSGPNHPYFLIRYEVTGCSRSHMPSYPGTTVELSENGETALVECEVARHVRWLLKCVDSRWRVDGDPGNCTTYSAEANDTPEDGYLWAAILPSGWTSPYGVVAVISLGVLFGLIIGSSLLGIAVCLLKWKRANKPGRNGGVAITTDRRQHVHSDDEDYMPGCHVISSAAGTQHKRTTVNGCDCGVLWPPLPAAERASLAMLQQQQSDSLPPPISCGGKTVYGTHNSFRRLDSVMTTPDLFLNSTLTTSVDSPTQPPPAHLQPEVTCSATTMAETSGVGIGRHVVTGPHYYESPMFSHHKGLLD